MRKGPVGARVRPQKRLQSATTLLAVLIGLLALSPLTGCANWGGASGTRATVATPSTSLTPATTGTAATPSKQASPWKLAWDSEFNGPVGAPPDPGKWTAVIGGGGWGNQQLDYDTDNQNVYQDGQGHLIIEARKGNPEGYSCWYGSCTYTSGQITTQGHFSFTYGRIEARIKIPSGQGLWSAFWLLGANYSTVGWPACGEVDVMENIGKEPSTIYGTVHGPGYSSGHYQLQHGQFSDDFHTFALQWDPNHLYFMVDGITYHTVDRTSFPKAGDWVYDHAFNIMLNLPVGGPWPGSPNAATVFPKQMIVSYVKVYSPA